MIDIQRAREIAMDWHGGQWSPLYSFGSSGVLENGTRIDKRDYLREIQENMLKGVHSTDYPRVELERLCKLWAFIDAYCPEPDEYA